MSGPQTHDLNEQGEFPGYGPQWACAKFGTTGHDYQNCPRCKDNYKLWLIWIGAPAPVFFGVDMASGPDFTVMV